MTLLFVASAFVLHAGAGSAATAVHGSDHVSVDSCGVGDTISPINIDSQNTVFELDDTSMRLNYSTWHSSNLKLQQDAVGGGIVFEFQGNNGGGRAQVGVRHDDMDEYILRNIRVRTPSEHTFVGRFMPIELQFWHEPTAKSDVLVFLEERRNVRASLDNASEKIALWQEQLQLLLGEDDVTLQRLYSEDTFLEAAKQEANRRGESVLEEVTGLKSQLKHIDTKLQALVSALERPRSLRTVVLSIFIHASEVAGTAHPHMSNLIAFLKSATSETNGHGEFSFLSFKDGPKDVASENLLKAYFYHGMSTGPCRRVSWFIASDPQIAFGRDLIELLDTVAQVDTSVLEKLSNGRASCRSAACLMEEHKLSRHIWWGGAVTTSERAQPALPNTMIRSVAFNVEPFLQIQSNLDSEVLESLSW
eukprot:CAMPEP_0194530158 /NCGR_PEP_ID=MMETSP0253-20130528/67021_1 /TAXON_ID=2966 /ORGANISM="Noctiluca scintillans" /LENGTH=418 /DNA_ID=CAMNT_0039375349 /DNA_START=70 /DNA_END=1323 /DNA_ORIENTATION=-